MPNPCNSFSPAAASFAVGPSALPSADPSSPAKGFTDSVPASSSFDCILSQVDEPAPPAETEGSAIWLSSAPMTAEQLAMMISMTMPNPAIVPPIPTQPELETADAAPSFKLLGAEGRSLPELLVSGANVLEYQAASPGVPTMPDSRSGMPVSTDAASPLPAAVTPLAPDGSKAVLNSPIPLDASPASAKSGAAWDARALRFRENQPVAAPPVSIEPLSSATTMVAGTTTDPVAALALSALASKQDQGQNPGPSNAQLNTAATAASATQGIAENFQKPKSSASERPEKFAASTLQIQSPKGQSLNVRGKNTILPVEGEQVDETDNRVGTVAANWGRAMAHEPSTFPIPARQTEVNSIEGLSSSGLGTTIDDLATVSPAHATDIVHEIREIADGLWAVERNSVEVKFNFGEQERLSVRVEYRDGTVRATFRTDSPDVRDAIAREWQAQSGVAEHRPYRVAEPIFAAAPPSSGFFSGGDASRQQRSPEQQSTPFERFNPGMLPRSAAAMTTSSPLPSSSPREATGHLHALV